MYVPAKCGLEHFIQIPNIRSGMDVKVISKNISISKPISLSITDSKMDYYKQKAYKT